MMHTTHPSIKRTCTSCLIGLLVFATLGMGLGGCSESKDNEILKVPQADGGVPYSPLEAGDTAGLERLTKLAKDGNAQARFALGVFYEREENYEEANFWYTLAVEKGVVAAHANLGRMYAEGLGIKRDDERAAELFRWAADKGDDTSQYNLGRMYQEGAGVNQSETEAISWLEKAAAQGFADAQNHLGTMYNNRSTPDFELAKDWYWLACQQGHAHAQYNLGVLYFNGQGVEVDYQRAYLWILLSSLGGHELAIGALPTVEAKLPEALIEQTRAQAGDWQNQLDSLAP
tara:strand:- start:108387 stop:109250 length:864 start_codon:yes stop_codon:yes gene_type:complete